MIAPLLPTLERADVAAERKPRRDERPRVKGARASLNDVEAARAELHDLER